MSVSEAPVLSTNAEFDRVQQASRSAPPLSPDQFISKYSLDQVAEEIYSYFHNSTQDDNCNTSCCKTNDADKSSCGCSSSQSKTDQTSKSVALQLPDRMIPDSAYLSTILEKQVENVYKKYNAPPTTIPRLYVLGDSSYSPCCVDTVAAQHINATVIVHFGTSCLSPVQGAHVIYVYGKENLEFGKESLAQLLTEHYKNIDDPIENLVFMYDPEYEYELQDFTAKYLSKLDNVQDIIQADLLYPNDGSTIIPKISTCEKPTPKQTDDSTDLPLDIPNRILKTEKNLTEDEFRQSGSIIYVTYGTPSSSYLLHLTTLASSVYLVDGTQAPGTINSPETSLQRRYRSMNITRTATTIGILINTLSIRNVGEAIRKVQKWITAADKKYYTFVVGKPNVPKLANFDVVDVWVILGCPLGGFIMSSNGGPDPSYYKQIITPYELKLALQPQPTWTGKWAIKFENIINNMKNLGIEEDDDEEEQEVFSTNDDESEAPEFDPVTGKYVSKSRPLRAKRIAHIDIQPDKDDGGSSIDKENNNNNKGLVVRHSSQLVIRQTVSTAADHLYNKLTWTGLGSDFNQQDEEDSEDDDEQKVDENGDKIKKEKRFATVEAGRGGIARNYGIVNK